MTTVSYPAILQKAKILVTRPIHQAEPLCCLIEQANGIALRLPAIEIVEIKDKSVLQHCAENLAQFDIAIFISVNAVQFSVPTLLAANTAPLSLQFIAVGKRTKDVLAQQYHLNAECPQPPYNTETLLQLPQLQQVNGKKIIIFRGEGGREVLAETLRQRNAFIQYVDLYRRMQPTVPAWFEQQTPDIAIVSSREGLQNLFDMLHDRPWIRRLPLVVMSARILAEARVMGVQAPIVIAPQACDEGLMEGIFEWHHKFRNTTA